jgi:hypothetical protein
MGCANRAHTRHSGENVRDYARRILSPGIVISNDHIVGEFCRNAAHYGPLSRIAIATASKHNAELSSAMQPRSMQCLG